MEKNKCYVVYTRYSEDERILNNLQYNVMIDGVFTSEIKAIRERFRSSKDCNMYKLNMIIHGDEQYEECITNLIKAKINS